MLSVGVEAKHLKIEDRLIELKIAAGIGRQLFKVCPVYLASWQSKIHILDYNYLVYIFTLISLFSVD